MLKDSSKKKFVYVTSYVGNLGTKILVEKKRDELQKHYSKDYLDKIYSECNCGDMPLFDYFDKEEIGKGGVLAALWKICDRNKLGLRYSLSKIPVLQGTIEFSNFFDLNPYRLLTGNSFVIISDRDDIEEWKLIGETNDEKKRVRIDGEAEAFLTKCYKDELDKICRLR